MCCSNEQSSVLLNCAWRRSQCALPAYQGHGKFIDKNTIEVNGQQLKFAAAVIATGASASVPPIQVGTLSKTITSSLISTAILSLQ